MQYHSIEERAVAGVQRSAVSPRGDAGRAAVAQALRVHVPADNCRVVSRVVPVEELELGRRLDH